MKNRFLILISLFMFSTTLFAVIENPISQEKYKTEVIEIIEDTSPLLIKVSDVL